MARGKKNEKEITIEERLEQALVPAEEQPYSVPENWCWVKLEELKASESGFFDGDWILSENMDSNGDVRLLQLSDIGEGVFLDKSNKHINSNVFKQLNCTELFEGDIMISRMAEPIARSCIVPLFPYKVITAVDVAVIRCNNKIIFNSYLNYVCNSKWFTELAMHMARGTTRVRITRNNLGQMPVPLPTLAEQQRIVDRIESLFAKLDEAKEKAQAVVDGFETRKAAILHKAFTGELTEKWRIKHSTDQGTWIETTIEKIADVKGGKRVPKGMNLCPENTGHPYIRAGNLKQGTVIDEGMMFVPDNVLSYIKNYTVSAGDVYITNVGACIGDCGVIPNKYDGANLTENAVKITNLKCDNKFLALFLSSNTVQQQIKLLIASATLGKLSIANIKKIEIYLPTLEEQKEIVSMLDDFLGKEQQAKETAEAVLDQIEAMKKSILARAFRGGLGTNDPEEESAVELFRQVL